MAHKKQKQIKKIVTHKKVAKRAKMNTYAPSTLGVKKAIVKKQNDPIRPLGSRVLIKPFTKEELAPKSNFGIILPDSDKKEKSEQGVVLATGLGSFHEGKFIPVSVKVGDIVAFSKYGYDDINLDGEELYLIKEENILAVLKK